MTNALLIKRLTDIKDNGGAFTTNLIDKLIEDLKEEELKRGFKGSDKQRLLLAKRLQKNLLNRRPVLAMYHKVDEEHYVFTDSAFLVKVDKDFVEQGELHTDDKDWAVISKDGIKGYLWRANQHEYPNVSECWLDNKADTKMIKVNAVGIMNFINANKEKPYFKLIVDNDTTIAFDRLVFYKAMVLSNAYKEKQIEFMYRGCLKPIQIGYVAVITPIRTCGSSEEEQYLTLDIRRA